MEAQTWPESAFSDDEHNRHVSTYKSNCANQVDIKGPLPVLGFAISNLSYRLNHAMIDDQSVEPSKLFCRKVNGLLCKREIAQIASDYAHMFGILLLDFLEGVSASGECNNVVGLLKQIFCNSKTDACAVGQLQSPSPEFVPLIPLEAPVTIMVFAILKSDQHVDFVCLHSGSVLSIVGKSNAQLRHLAAVTEGSPRVFCAFQGRN